MHVKSFQGYRIVAPKDVHIPLSRTSGAENLHFTLNGEIRRAPEPPVAGAQTAWENADQVIFALCGTPTDKPEPEQHSPLDRPTSTREKKEKLSNKQ
jgi:hypothetical protein